MIVLEESKAGYSACSLLHREIVQLWAFEKVVQIRTHAIWQEVSACYGKKLGVAVGGPAGLAERFGLP
jgi:hypothetical protein